jgi:hypothetical protein
MLSEEEFLKQVDDKLENYVGQIDHFYEVVGMIIVGRHCGWRVMRLVSSARCWKHAGEIFGDPKNLMPERGKYAYKSVGLRIADRLGQYWDIVRGYVKVSKDERRLLE